MAPYDRVSRCGRVRFITVITDDIKARGLYLNAPHLQ